MFYQCSSECVLSNSTSLHFYYFYFRFSYTPFSLALFFQIKRRHVGIYYYIRHYLLCILVNSIGVFYFKIDNSAIFYNIFYHFKIGITLQLFLNYQIINKDQYYKVLILYFNILFVYLVQFGLFNSLYNNFSVDYLLI